ncbi:hypothetical protein BOX15_Mlig001154g6 [Macrostomum lignano]|uniref:Thioredoxin domain-containing protein n=1 Tax=Macrostomum lignano TaxID=282301 RepID=A0A267DA20_9PLAT|nr:hypothetical protein BOX15_Mlig001154g6 [Macrostomum lignano]
MLYFSAHWCPPCRSFTPVLAKFYAEAKAANKAVECVFVSCDRDEASMWSYMNESHGDYYVVPFDAEERKGLSEQYGVSGIPAWWWLTRRAKCCRRTPGTTCRLAMWAALTAGRCRTLLTTGCLYSYTLFRNKINQSNNL